MSLKYRRILFGFFVLLFILMVPLVLLYATGHTINWKRLSLEKTGSILVESDPAGAAIFINGEAIKQGTFNALTDKNTLTTPSRIKDLAPGEYSIRLESYGYWPWEERINLAPGEALNLGTIHLYNQSKPYLISSFDSANVKVSPNGLAIAIIENNKLSIFNTETNKEDNFTLPKIINNNAPIEWSGDSQRLIVDELIVDRNKKTVETIKQAGANNFRWNRDNSSLLYFLSNKKLFVKEIENNQERQANIQLPKNIDLVIDFNVYNNQVYLLAKDNEQNNYLVIGTFGSEMKKISLDKGSYTFIEENFYRPTFISGKKLYILDQPLPILDRQKIIQVSDRYIAGKNIDSSIIYTTPLELRRWDNENQEYLINRFGAPVNTFLPLTKTSAIVAALDNSLKLYIPGKNSITLNLISKISIQEITVDSEEKNIYLIGKYQEKSGLFKLPLNEKPDFSSPTLKDTSTTK